MSDDIRLEGDGEIQITDIEASAPEGRKPRIRTKPAYSGGKLDVAWNVNVATTARGVGETRPNAIRVLYL